MVEVDGSLINKHNITYVENHITDSDGYTWKKTYHISIHFTGGEVLKLKTYDETEFNSWLNELK